MNAARSLAPVTITPLATSQAWKSVPSSRSPRRDPSTMREAIPRRRSIQRAAIAWGRQTASNHARAAIAQTMRPIEAARSRSWSGKTTRPAAASLSRGPRLERQSLNGTNLTSARASARHSRASVRTPVRRRNRPGFIVRRILSRRAPAQLRPGMQRLAKWWARQGLNLRPHPCEGCALPLSYAPAGGPVRAACTAGARLCHAPTFLASGVFGSARAHLQPISASNRASHPLGDGGAARTAAGGGHSRQ